MILVTFVQSFPKINIKSISMRFFKNIKDMNYFHIWTLFHQRIHFWFSKALIAYPCSVLNKIKTFNARLRDHLHHLIYICLPESKMTKMKVSIKFVLNVPLPSRRVALIRPKNNLLGSMFLKWCILFLKDNK